MELDLAEKQLWWASTQTIATFAGLSVIVLQIATFMYARIVRTRALDPGRRAAEDSDMSYFRVPKLSWWAAFRGSTTEIPQITTIRGLIEAGDLYLWTSAALDHLPLLHGNLSWVPLYAAVYSQVAENTDADISKQMETLTESPRTTKPSITSLAIKRAREASLETSARQKLYSRDGALMSCVKRLDSAGDGRRSPGPSPKKGRGLADLTPAWMIRGSPCIPTSREELAALALVLGVSLKTNDFTQNVSGVGPFGTGFDMMQDNGVWRFELIHGSRLPRHAPSNSSGYSVLFAKHLPFGSLPFAENRYWVRSIYVNLTILEAIKKGCAIKDGKSFGGGPLQTLRSLPAAKQIDAYYHAGSVELGQDELGSILKSDDMHVELQIDITTTKKANWCRAVVGIAFGGLVPQASTNLAEAVSFTLGADLLAYEVGDIVDGLENLVNALHFGNREANIFGEHVTERCFALELVDNVHYATPNRYNVQEAAAIFARFMNLLERLAFLSRHTVESIFETTVKSIGRVYWDVIKLNRGNEKDPRSFEMLGRDLETEIKELTENCLKDSNYIVTLEDCTLVIWCILLVWAARVPHGESEDFQDHDILHKEGADSNRKGPSTMRAVSLADLPQLMAFS